MIEEFPLFIFTLFAGLAAGAYIFRAIFSGKAVDDKRPWLFPLITIILLGIGLIGVMMHLAHPERFLNALMNPTAGISLEGWFSIGFGVFLLIDLILCFARKSCPKVIVFIGAILALILTCVMGYSYFEVSGISEWASPVTFLLFICDDLLMGAALYAVFNPTIVKNRGFTITSAIVGAVAVVDFIIEAVMFTGDGAGFVAAYIVAAVLALAGIVVLLVLAARERNSAAAWSFFILCFIGVLVARYAFYAVY